MAKTYVGTRSSVDEFEIQVKVEEGGVSRPLANVGLNDADFEWGYGGSGPAALAYSILFDHLGDRQEAERLYHRFKEECISGLERDGFRIEAARVAEWCASKKPTRTRLLDCDCRGPCNCA